MCKLSCLQEFFNHLFIYSVFARVNMNGYSLGISYVFEEVSEKYTFAYSMKKQDIYAFALETGLYVMLQQC